MKFLESLFQFFDARMQTPTLYGWFHLLWLVITVAVAVILVVKFRDCNDKTFRRIMLIAWLFFLIPEVYKQLIYSISLSDGQWVWDFQWYAFPFQLCSTPLYVYPLVAFLKDGKLRDMAISFSALFAFFGGLAVMLYPGDVFISIIGINIQTMINHGGQVAFGIFCAARYRKQLSTRFWLKSLPIFGGLFLIATVLNIAAYHLLPLVGIDETFNMFFISPYYDTTLPVLSMFNGLPHIFLSLIYLAAFTLISFVMYWLHRGVYLLCLRLYQKHKEPQHEA